ncbi:helix-turn-helix transcriptional regulator [Brevibacillus choshinensis]|uniref:helix-turn-helix domain-containing protein n=1 Tax=Brevibacillus choshinensis TaxID=54911 RepID=UPI002E22EB46|nr:helix-turn-helix transcriptional regulator [Brevibacillus choshinensis]
MDNLFGERLRTLREEKNMSQEELAEAFGMGRVAVSGYERGKRTPSFELLVGFAEHFDVSTDYLLGRTGLRTPLKSLESFKALTDVMGRLDPSEHEKFIEFAMWTLQSKSQNRP